MNIRGTIVKVKNTKDLKIANKHMLLNCIRKNGRLSILDIEHMTNMSRPTVSGLVREMEAQGLIVKAGLGLSSGGRAPMLYCLNADAHYAIGIDIELPKVWINITNLTYHCIASRMLTFPHTALKNEILDRILSATEGVIEQAGIEKKRILGMGIGIPGVIDHTKESSVTIERIPDWRNVPVVQIFSEKFGIPVYLENDANLLALAQYRLSKQPKSRNRLFINIRYGIGTGIIMDGRLLTGSTGNAGRLGHVSVNANGPQCVCGNHGCLSLYASAHAIVDRYNELTGDHADNIKQIAQIAEKGQYNARRVLVDAGHYLGAAVLSLTNLFDISDVTLCTQFSPTILREEIQKAIDNRTKPFSIREIALHTMQDNSLDIHLGGCIMVVDQYNRQNKR